MLKKTQLPVDPAAARFVVVFFVLAATLTLLLQITWVDGNLVGPYVEAITAIAGVVLELLGRDVEVTTTIIREQGFAVDIRRGCDGIVASILLISACLAFPMQWRSRIQGTLYGYLLIFALNMVRIVGLFLLGASGSRALFDFFHVYVSQFAVIALTMVFWLYWAGRNRPVVSS